MNRKEQQQIERIFYPGWLMASQLRSGLVVHDGKALYRRACQVVEEARTALTEAGYSDARRDHMVYALCALLDERVMNRGTTDDGYQAWYRDPLQAHFFGTLNAGEAVWALIREKRHDPEPDTAVLTCLYRTLQLGFVGQYRSQDDEQREDVVKALAERVPGFTLAQDAPIVVMPSQRHSGRQGYWLFWVTGAGMLAALWLVLSSSLTELVNQIILPG
ncbi:type VI secretion system protein TssL, short form [Mangrovibacter plantisponsor]|uniref:Type VI secretion system protein ImpK n=1 Tax=Mangrovibacter plantisponsor TaxID=451513 RepID=A0A317Q5T7_9ENTR|nr:type VI secretion system protein TssL, short form [Mangrovibacter plantisponsor]PWW09467.1 type VI secretion system protein ImpK [Mangrovibacter plantisponsor]